MRLGTSKVDITPPVGTELTGFVARQQPSTEVVDRLYARVVILKELDSYVGFVSLDLLAISLSFINNIRAELSAKGIDGSCVMFCASHTHSGPALVELRDCGCISPEYISFLERAVAGAVCQAHEVCNLSCDDICLEFSEEPVDGLSYNRRDAERGPIDATLRVMRLVESTGVKAYIVNYACHGVCMCDGGISGDYISHLCRHLENNSGAVTIFMNGPSADINPTQRGRESARIMGETLARQVLDLSAVQWIPVSHNQSVESSSITVWIPFVPLPNHDALLAYAESSCAGLNSHDWVARKISRAMVGWALDVSRGIDEGSLPEGITVEVMVNRVGGVFFLGLPGEIFTAIGLAIRTICKRALLIISAHTNGSVGYVPSLDEYSKGGYELEAYKWYNYPAVIAPQASQVLIDTATKLIHQLY